MSLPFPPQLTSDNSRDILALQRYLFELINNFDNASGQAIDPTEGQSGNSSLTIIDPPSNIVYTPTSSLSVDGTLFGNISITFTLPARAIGALIYYKEHTDLDYHTSFAKTSPYSIPNLKVGIEYDLQMAGQAANGDIGPLSSVQMVTMPTTVLGTNTPTNVQAVATYQSIVVTWTEPAGGALLKYEVQVADDALFTINVATYVVDVTYFILDTGVIGAVKYLRVRSVDKAGNFSAYSPSVTTTTLNVPDASIFTAKIVDLNVTTAKLDDKAVTYAKIQDVAAASLLGRESASAGVTEEISASAGLQISGTVLSAQYTFEIAIGDPLGSQIAIGDSKAYIRIPPDMNGMNLVAVGLSVSTVSSSSLPTYQIRRVRAGVSADMLSTKVSVDVNEVDSSTAATPPVIDTANDDVATGDQIFCDKDVAGTGEKGDLISLRFALP